MPLGDIVGQALVELVLEIVIKVPGCFIARRFKPGVDPDSGWSIAAGLLLWGVLGALGFLAWRALTA